MRDRDREEGADGQSFLTAAVAEIGEDPYSTGIVHYDKLADALLKTFFTTDPSP